MTETETETVKTALRQSYLALLTLAYRTGVQIDDGRRWCAGTEVGAYWLANRLGFFAADSYSATMRTDDREKYFREKRFRTDDTLARLPALADAMTREAFNGDNPLSGL